MAAQIFQFLADAGVSVDMIIQSQRSRPVDGYTTRDIACTVAQADADHAKQVLDQVRADIGYHDVVLDTQIAKVSVVGVGMIYRPGVAAKMFRALADLNINIQMIATSEIKISCVVGETEGVQALQAIHNAFGLSGTEAVVVPA